MRGSPEVVMWGTGTPKREFLHVDDLADADVYLMRNYEGEDIVNIGVGDDIPIRELAQIVSETVGFTGRIVNDTTKPDGTPRKLMDVTRLSGLGWKAKIALREGIASTYSLVPRQPGRTLPRLELLEVFGLAAARTPVRRFCRRRLCRVRAPPALHPPPVSCACSGIGRQSRNASTPVSAPCRRSGRAGSASGGHAAGRVRV